jgi:glycosyltransferase involved in cell wall biosynthesis
MAEALDSVLAQTYKNWECIIINDGSTDGTEKIAKAYEEKDKRFKYQKKQNGGLSSARNAGLKIATGEWIQFLDSDDYIVPQKFELALGLLNDHPGAEIIVSDFKMFVDRPGDATDAYCQINQECLTFENILVGWDAEFNIPIHCGLFKASLFRENYFVESLKVSEDLVMWLNLFNKKVKAVFLDQALAYYRINPNSMTKDKVFLRNNLVEAYIYIMQTLPTEYQSKFISSVLHHLYSTLLHKERDIERLEAKLYYKLEKKAKDILRPIVKRGRK